MLVEPGWLGEVPFVPVELVAPAGGVPFEFASGSVGEGAQPDSRTAVKNASEAMIVFINMIH